MKRKSFNSYQNRPYQGVNVQPEVKYFDVCGNPAIANTADWTGTEVVCSNYLKDDGVDFSAGYTDAALIPSANGPGYGEILGKRYQIVKLCVQGSVTIDQEEDDPDRITGVSSRLVLVMDKKAGGSQLQGEQVFDDPGIVDILVHAFPQQGQVTNRFEILEDVRFVHDVSTNPPSNVKTGWHRKHFSFVYVPPKPLIVNVLTSGATPAIGQLKDINIFMLHRATEPSHVAFCSRCYYIDA